jgi:hypothetical protein
MFSRPAIVRTEPVTVLLVMSWDATAVPCAGLPEQRVNPNTTAGTGGEFVPPVWLVSDYVKYARPARPTADRCTNKPPPPGTDIINIPEITLGALTAIQPARGRRCIARTGGAGSGHRRAMGRSWPGAFPRPTEFGGTALIAEGVAVKTAQTRLGHSSPQVTLAIYARATFEGDRLAADKVGERFRPRDARGMRTRAAGGPDGR